MPYEVVLGFIDHTEEYLAAGPRKQTVLALTAGSFICLGAMLSIVLSLGVTSDGVARFLLGPGLPGRAVDGECIVVVSARGAVDSAPVRLRGTRVCALMTCHRSPPSRTLVEDVRRHVGQLVVVSDGMPDEAARALAVLADEIGFEYLLLTPNRGKGYAIAAGLRGILDSPEQPDAVLVIDGDGQHPPAAIPSFLAAAQRWELVVGDRFGDLAAMPWPRRYANRVASRLLERTARRPVRDSQCGMRLLRGRALHDVRFEPGGYEAESDHLKRCLRARVAVTWVPIPAVYAGQPSSFQPVRDGVRVLRAILR